MKLILELFLSKHPTWSSFILHSLVISLTFFWFTPIFQSVDDTIMLFKASGVAFSQEPTTDLLFINIILTTVITTLYKFFPEMNFYAWLFFIGMFLAYWQIATTIFKQQIFRQQISSIFLVFYLIFFILVGLKHFVSLQFTIVAALLAFAGFIKLFFDNSKTFGHYFIVCLLVVFATLIRFESTILIILNLLPIVIFHISKTFKSQKLWLNKVILQDIFVFIFILGVCWGITNYHLQIWGRENVENFEALKQFIDYHKLEKATPLVQKTALEAANWTPNDYNMLTSWFYADKDLYNTQKLHKILKHLSDEKTNFEIKKLYNLFYPIFKSHEVKMCLLVAVVLLLFCSKSVYILTIINFCAILFYSFLMDFFLKPPPPRVFEPMFFCLAFCPLLFIDKKTTSLPFYITFFIKKYPAQKYLTIPFNYLLILGISMLLIARGIIFYQYSSSFKADNQLLKQWLQRIEVKSDNIFVVCGGGFPYEAVLPFEKKDYLENLNLVSTQHNMTNVKQMKKLGLTNLYTDLVTKDNVFLICRKPVIDFYILFMQEHYQMKVSIKNTIDYKEGRTMVKFTKK